MPEAFKPLEITEPRYPYIRADGTEATFDPWEFTREVEEAPPGILANADAVRKFLGYPTSDEVAAATGDKPPTIPLGNCQQLQALVMDFIADLPSTKKKLAASRKLSALDAK